MRAPSFLALLATSYLAACTLIESKDGLVGPPLASDAGSGASPLAPDAAASATHDAGSSGGSGGGGGGGSNHDGGSGADASNDGGPGAQTDDAGPSGPVAIYTGRTSPLGIAVHNGTICWVEGDSFRTIVCGPTTGGASLVSTVASQTNDPFVEQAFDVALDDANYYWSNGPKNQVVQKPRSGGASSQYFTGDSQVSYIVLEGTTVWMSDYVPGASSGNVSYGPFSGSQSQLIYPTEKQAAGVATYGGSVYWGTPSTVSMGPEGGNATIERVKTAGAVTGLAIDGAGTTYFLVGNRDVYRLPLASNTPVLVSSPSSGAAFGESDLALDDGAVYWSEHDNGRIMRLAR